MDPVLNPDRGVAIGVSRGHQHLIFARAMAGGKAGRIGFKCHNIDEKGNELPALPGVSVVRWGQFDLFNAFANIDEKDVNSIARAILF